MLLRRGAVASPSHLCTLGSKDQIPPGCTCKVFKERQSNAVVRLNMYLCIACL
jgi:hypothetical protein